MSYDKNTYNFSDIVPIVRELIRNKEKYYLFTLGTVRAKGCNDDFRGIDDYNISILIYKGGVLLEQMRRTDDCDSDDCVVSESFNFDQIPDMWYLERTVDYEHFVDYNGAIVPEFTIPVELAKYKSFVKEFVK